MSEGSGSTVQSAVGPPIADDIQLTSQLESFLVEAGVYETEEGNIKRQEAISEIERICNEWVKQLARQKGYTDLIVEKANAIIFTCGSYRLQVHEPGDDLDLLCVGPSYVERENDLFMVLCNLLAQNEEVSELQSLPDAHVPVMAFKFRGVSTNLFYASVSLLGIPQDLDISQQSVIYNIDEATMCCLNERRVADMILDLVPDVMSFQTTLRCLKYWAKRRGVYSKVMGFLGDMSLAILVAHVCQLYPNAIPSILVSKFFHMYAEWPWPNPVGLCAIEDNEELGFTVWSQNSEWDMMHFMPIITPAYPFMNSSKEVSLGTLHIMIEQFDCANQICQKIELNDSTWSALFEPYNFFEEYSTFIQVDIVAADVKDHLGWKRWVESQLIKFTVEMEKAFCDYVGCHLYPGKFTDPTKQVPHCAFFIGMFMMEEDKLEEGRRFSLRATVDEFRLNCKAYQYWKPGMNVHLKCFYKEDIPFFVFLPS